jgi:uncharacterized protein (DUF2062 family)
VGATCSTLGYLAIRGLWRWHVVRDWERRKEKRVSSEP